MPTRSTGCITCRKRKIRCDEGLPGCKRCATHGVRCQGYSNVRRNGIEFRDQTSITAKRAEERYRAKALSSSPTETASSTPSSRIWDGLGSTTPEQVATWSEDGYPTVVNPTEELLEADLALVEPGNTIAISPFFLRSPSAERTQIYEQFLTTYLPKVRHTAQDGHFSFYRSIAERQSNQPALEKGMDALSLVQLGSLYKDQKLLREATRQYGVALRYLATSISRGDFLHDDDVLATVTCLASCELYEEIANMGRGWTKHVEGANQLAAARGPQSFKSELSLLLFANMRHGALLHALIARKEPFMATPAWRKLAFSSPLVRDESTTFYDIAIQIPGLLQRHDELDMEAVTAVADIDKILGDSAKLELELRHWYMDWQAAATLDNHNDRELRPIESFSTFASLVSDRTFDYAYMFPDFLVAYLYTVFWMVIYHLRTNIQSLQKLRHRLLVEWYPEPEDVVADEELLGYVLDLCQSIPFFVEPVSNSAGHIGIFMPLRTAAMYFTDRGHWRWLKWIGEVRNNVFVKGLAPPGVANAGRESSVITSS